MQDKGRVRYASIAMSVQQVKRNIRWVHQVQGGCKDTKVGGLGEGGSCNTMGIARGAEVNRQGGGVVYLLFLPMMPPRMQRGMVTNAQMTMITTMVPKGKACVDCSNSSLVTGG